MDPEEEVGKSPQPALRNIQSFILFIILTHSFHALSMGR
jgi:hypothetical protein